MLGKFSTRHGWPPFECKLPLQTEKCPAINTNQERWVRKQALAIPCTQEYTMLEKGGNVHGWPLGGFPAPQGALLLRRGQRGGVWPPAGGGPHGCLHSGELSFEPTVTTYRM